MARPHIDYLQSQALPWQANAWPHLRGCQTKTLSLDPDTGATSLIVRFPSGWTAPAPDFLGAAEELFVLEGLLELDGCRYGQDCYGWFPAGWRHAVRTAPDGAVALVFYDAEPAARPGGAVAGGAGEPLRVDAFERPWADDRTALVFGGQGHRWKVLHGEPERGPATLLISSPAHLHPPGWCAPQEIHSCAEELFVLSGDFLTNAGHMASGAYVWRPARVPHGPYGSRGGNLTLVRTHDGPLATDFTAHELTLERAPDYQPLLPPGLRALITHPWRAQRY
jgi:hypothetical protein